MHTNSLGERIKIARGPEPQDSFAVALGISRGSLSLYERNEGQPNADVLLKICALRDISPTWLLAGEGPMRRGFGDAPPIKGEPASVRIRGGYAPRRRPEKRAVELPDEAGARPEHDEKDLRIQELERQLAETKEELLRAYRLATQSMPPATQKVQEEPDFTTGGQDNTQASETSLIHQNGSPNEAK